MSTYLLCLAAYLTGEALRIFVGFALAYRRERRRLEAQRCEICGAPTPLVVHRGGGSVRLCSDCFLEDIGAEARE